MNTYQELGITKAVVLYIILFLRYPQVYLCFFYLIAYIISLCIELLEYPTNKMILDSV